MFVFHLSLALSLSLSLSLSHALITHRTHTHARTHTAPPRLFDILPGESSPNSTFSGFAGFVLDLTAPGSSPLTLTRLGRFRVRGNSRAHRMDVVSASTGASVLPSGAPLPSVDLSPSGCPASDTLGFCYSEALAAPVTLHPGQVYYIVCEEAAGGDAFLAMHDAAAATTHAHRDGTTLMGYAGPGLGVVNGRVYREGGGGGWVVEPFIELMYGPLNFLFAR